MTRKSLFICALMLMSKMSFALYGAKPVAPRQFGFVGSLHLRDEENKDVDFFCSAVLVSPKHVLTAAHCIEGLGRDKYDDVYYLNQFTHFLKVKFDGKLHSVKAIKYAVSYFDVDGRAGEDLALIELDRPVVGVTPVKRYNAGFKIGQDVLMVARGHMAPTKLVKASRYRESGAVLITTEGSVSGTCGGDSGGALLTKVNNEWALAGLLMHDTEIQCAKRNSISYGPFGHF